jgi:hypothetical protein
MHTYLIYIFNGKCAPNYGKFNQKVKKHINYLLNSWYLADKKSYVILFLMQNLHLLRSKALRQDWLKVILWLLK